MQMSDKGCQVHCWVRRNHNE